jgi:hypothetical protein
MIAGTSGPARPESTVFGTTIPAMNANRYKKET